MRILSASLCAIALTLFAAPGPARADSALTGQMASFSYLLGAPWNCTSNVPAMGDMAAHTDHLTVAFDVAPHNTMHDHVTGDDYMGDDYYGYSTRMSNYWSTSADNEGGHGLSTSTDGKTYSGMMGMGGMRFQQTTTYTKVDDNHVTMHQTMTAEGQPATTIESACSR